MSDKPGDNKTIRQYLLGTIDPAERDKIEARLWDDDAFFNEIVLMEEDLIQEYVDDDLSGADRRAFEGHFMITEERQTKLRFARSLRKYVDQYAPANRTRTERTSRFGGFFKRAFRSPLLAGAFFALLAVLFFGWYFVLRSTVDQRTTIALNRIYKSRRPLESRISALNYAPFVQMRGDGEGKAEKKDDPPEIQEIKLDLLKNVRERKTAENLHALGRFYLAKQEFDNAITHLEDALQFAPQNAQIRSDLGGAYIEKSKVISSDQGGQKFKLQGQGLEEFEKALEIDPKLREALFNKGLALELMGNSFQARETWEAYLKLDSTSRWADEARDSLRKLEVQKPQSKTGDDLLQDFLDAFRARDDEKAYQIVSRNREMISGKLIPQRLAKSFLETNEPGAKAEYLAALKYIGDLENERSGDPFWKEIAAYHSSILPKNQHLLRYAHISLNRGCLLWEKGNYIDASLEFTKARGLFHNAGNLFETLICDYWIACSDYRNDKITESDNRLRQLAEICRRENYKWMSSHTAYWLSVIRSVTGDYSRSLEYSEDAIEKASETSDLYNLQRTYASLVDTQILLGRYPDALSNMNMALSFSRMPDSSPRQKCRSYNNAAQLLFELKLYRSAASFEKEALSLNDAETKDNSFKRVSLAFLGRIYAGMQKYDQAMHYARAGQETAEKLKDEADRKKGIAFGMLQIADLLREQRLCDESLPVYEKTIALYESMEARPYQYQAEKGRFLCFVAKRDTAAIEAKFPAILELFEKYRNQILEESNRNSFFDREQSIYDLAIDFEYKRANFEQAFNYSELSRSRSLLDWQKNGGKIEIKKGVPQVVFEENIVTQPLSFSEIRSRLPEEIQVVQYAVLADRIIIWLISSENFQVFTSEIPATNFDEKIRSFIGAIRNHEHPAQDVLARELYALLFSPIADHLNSDKQLVIIPDKTLYYLPFAALVSENTGRFLLIDHKLSFSPSTNSLLVSTETARRRIATGEETILSVGDPSFDKTEFPSFKNLPDAKKEAQSVAGLYPKHVVLLGPTATKSNLLKNLSQVDVVQIAGHYSVDELSPLLSCLLVAGKGAESRLANYELLQQEKLDKAKLIVLSACQSGVEGYYKGEGIVGAGRSFLALGVPLVVASQWKVESDSTEELMKQFHFYRRKENLSTAAALQRAQMEMLNNPYPLYREPYYWAGFMSLGGYAEF